MPPRDDDLIPLVDDGEEPNAPVVRPFACWKVLVVDDDDEVHAATRFAVENAVILGRPLKVISAYSAVQAKTLLKVHPDVAVILLDVVMEEHDSGLRLVQWIRAEGLVSQRIILRTGQPGYAPELDVIRNYDINDYRAKSELTHTRLVTAMTSAIRSYEQIEAIERSRRGLEAMVESCNRLLRERDVARFCEGVLVELSSLLQTPCEGLICQGRAGGANDEMRVVTGVGRWARYVGSRVGDFPDDAFLNTVRSYGATSGAPVARMINAPRLPWVMFNIEARPERRYLICLDHDAPLGAVDAALLRVFAANIAAGFENVDLIESLAVRNVDLERFAFAAAHDLQEPLRKIAVLADVVAKQVEIDDVGRDHLGAMHASAAHMRKLVGRLLEYVTLSRDELELEDIPLAEIVVDVEESFRAALAGAGATLEAGPLPWVRGDSGSLRRVLTLLIENAIAYRDAEPLLIRLTAETDGEDVTLAVADNGRGFDPDRCEDIFAAFRRLHRQADVPGAGLGLSIAKRLVGHHGGRLWAESAPGLGATFFVKLPRARNVGPVIAREEQRLLEAMPELLAIVSSDRLAS